jgi:hypothetical protein
VPRVVLESHYRARSTGLALHLDEIWRPSENPLRSTP